MAFDVRMDAKPVVRFLAPTGSTSFQAALIRNYRDILPEIADKLISTIRAGNWFANESGNLKKKMYKSGVRATRQGASIDVGWSGDAAIYGPVLETGPKKKSWVIKPKAQGVKALRFSVGGKVMFAKKVTINWQPKSLRPHVSKAMDKIDSWVKAKMDQAIIDADRAVS